MLLQEPAEPDMQGRGFGVQQLMMNSVMPAGMLIFGPIADALALQALSVVTGALMAIPGVWLYSYRQPKVPASAPLPSDSDG